MLDWPALLQDWRYSMLVVMLKHMLCEGPLLMMHIGLSVPALGDRLCAPLWGQCGSLVANN